MTMSNPISMSSDDYARMCDKADDNARKAMSKQEVINYINENVDAFNFEFDKLDFIMPKRIDATFGKRIRVIGYETNDNTIEYALDENVLIFSARHNNGVLVHIDGPLGRIELKKDGGKYVEA